MQNKHLTTKLTLNGMRSYIWTSPKRTNHMTLAPVYGFILGALVWGLFLIK